MLNTLCQRANRIAVSELFCSTAIVGVKNNVSDLVAENFIVTIIL